MRAPLFAHPIARMLCVAAATVMLGSVAVAGPATAGPSPAQGDEAKATSIQGTAVRAGNGKPIAGVLVTARDVVDLSVLGSDVTDSRGVYRINGLDGDEYAIKFNGRAKGFEVGYLACGNGVSAAVVASWGDACSHGTGMQVKARLQQL